jgi:hypothetical protein
MQNSDYRCGKHPRRYQPAAVSAPFATGRPSAPIVVEMIAFSIAIAS